MLHVFQRYAIPLIREWTRKHFGLLVEINKIFKSETYFYYFLSFY